MEKLTSKEKIHIIKPSVLVLSGLPLTGKTTIGKSLFERTNTKIIDVDAVREELDEERKRNPNIRFLSPDEELAIMIRSYCKMCERGYQIVQSGAPVILIGTFSREQFKEPLEKLKYVLEISGIPMRVFLISTPEEVIKIRIAERQLRGSLSNIDSIEKFQWAKSIFRKITFSNVVELRTDKSLEETVDELLLNLEDLRLN